MNSSKESHIEEVKQCIIAPSKKEIRKVKEKKERVKRVITATNQWKFTKEDLTIENQFEVIQNPKHESYRFVLQQMRMKAHSYKTQDLEKGKYDEIHFICIDDIIQKLVDSKLCCFYCKNSVHVLYEYVREPSQWTLERLDNSIGHTSENVVISCLSCNLRRRCMNYEKYIFTKQVQIVKIDNSPNR